MGKSKILRKSYPRVREIEVKGIKMYQVDPRRQLKGKLIGGKREAFISKRRALARADEISSQTMLDGTLSVSMDSELRIMALKSKAALEPFGKTIADAVDFYKDFLVAQHAKEESQTISSMVDSWWREKKFKQRRKLLRAATVEDFTETGNILKRNFGNMKILSVSKNDFGDYLDSLNVSQRRKYNLRSRFSQFFNWCIHEKEIPMKNPMAKIVIEVPEKEVPIMTPAQAEELLRLCQKKYPHLLAFHAVSLFAGLRPSEALYLDWSDIHAVENELQVKPHTSKTKKTRNVPVNQTLKLWLDACKVHKKGYIINPINTRSNLEKLRAELGFRIGGKNPLGDRWQPDITRHTYASYWLKIHNNKHLLSEIMGNSPAIIDKHYKAIVYKSAADAFWNITP